MTLWGVCPVGTSYLEELPMFPELLMRMRWLCGRVDVRITFRQREWVFV